MKLNEYQSAAWEFALPQSRSNRYLIPGLVGEVGELCSLVAKASRDGGSVDEMLSNVKKELGDILWFVAGLSSCYGYDLEDIAAGNINKLTSRRDRGAIQGSGDDR